VDEKRLYENTKVTTMMEATNPIKSASKPTFRAYPIFLIPTAPK
jgi:hypothetical protein